MAIRKAEKQQAKLRLAVCGPTGSGKTYTSLAIATAIAAALGGKVGVIDTERNSACLYSDKFEFDVEPDMQTFAPGAYVEKIQEFADLKYPVLVIDSLSHAWSGAGGALQMVDDTAKRMRSGNNFAAWREVTPEHNNMVEAILAYPGHVIVTMRSKMDYVLEEDAKGKKVPRKVGMAPIQRDGVEYEFTVVGDMDTEHNMIITKSRCSAIADKLIKKPGEALAKTLMDWLNDGAPPPAPVMATSEQLAEIARLEESGRITDDIAKRMLEHVHVTRWQDMTQEGLQKCIDWAASRPEHANGNGQSNGSPANGRMAGATS